MRNSISSILTTTLFVIVLILSSCASHRQGTDVLSQKNFIASGAITLKTGSNDMTAPAKMTINREKMTRLQVMMPLLGSELFRVEFTPETILVLDRTNKQYLKESYSTVSKLAGTDFSYALVQALALDYLAKQDEMTIGMPGNNSSRKITVKGSFNDIKTSETQEVPTEISSKYKKMSLSDLSKLLK